MIFPCPCGSGADHAHCCQPLIMRIAYPASAEALMRSRYSAYHKGDIDYLLHTRHPSQRALDSLHDLKASMESIYWRSLIILSSTPNGAEAEVEFVAFYVHTNQGPGQIHERSRFRKEGEQWYYVDGIHLPALKLQRNDPCWCGSGKKLKKCCEK